MSNPNNNMNAYNQALKINRALKKRIDRANLIVDDLLEANEHLQYLHDLKEVLNAQETTDS
jgi:hypoxanthine-guanine phosphoribosyltransferase